MKKNSYWVTANIVVNAGTAKEWIRGCMSVGVNTAAPIRTPADFDSVRDLMKRIYLDQYKNMQCSQDQISLSILSFSKFEPEDEDEPQPQSTKVNDGN